MTTQALALSHALLAAEVHYTADWRLLPLQPVVTWRRGADDVAAGTQSLVAVTAWHLSTTPGTDARRTLTRTNLYTSYSADQTLGYT